jgi:hypothetical protein
MPCRHRHETAALMETLEPRLFLDVTPAEQLFVYELNRARHDPAAYATQAGLGVNFSAIAPSQPLAVNNDLFESSEFHATEMATFDYLAHQSAVTGDFPNKMARDAGYALPAAWPNAANYIEAYSAGSASAITTLNNLLIDAANNPPAYRYLLLSMLAGYKPYSEIGVGYAFNAASTFDSYWVVHTAYRSSPQIFVTGVVYQDVNQNGLYDLNEGLAGVSLNNGSTIVTTNAQGGYAMPISGLAPMVITCSGGAFLGAGVATLSATNQNIEVDFVAGQAEGIVNFGQNLPQAPTAPAGVAATDGAFTDRVRVSWNNVAGAASYEIWRHTVNNVGAATLLDTSVTATCDDMTAVPGTTYFYWVRAVNAVGPGPFGTVNAGFANAAPTVANLAGAPDPVDRGQNLTLTATGVADIDGTAGWVRFYRDSNASGDWDAADAILGWGRVVGGTAVWTGSTTPFAYGANTFFARAQDNLGAYGAAAADNVTINNPDPVAPTAVLTAPDLATPNGAGYNFQVTYADNVAVNARSIGSGDVRVTGPGGYDQSARLVSVDNWANGTPRVATYTVYGTGRTWDFTDNGTYTVTMADNAVLDTNANPVAGGVLGTFDVAISDKPDLSVAFGAITMPDTVVPGDWAWVSIIVTNVGGVEANAIVTHNLYFSADQALGGDLLLATQTSALRLAPGYSRTFSFRTTVPGNIPVGDYHLLAYTDVANVIANEATEVNNVAATVGQKTVAWQFGAAGGRTGVSLTLNDADGTPVTFGLRGAGTGTVTTGLEGLDVTLLGTNNRSYVSVGPGRMGGGNGEADLGDVVVGNPAAPGDRTDLGTFYGRGTDLHGDFTTTGGLTSLTLDDILGPSAFTVGAWTDPRASLTVMVDSIADWTVNSAMPIRTFYCGEWLDTGGVKDSLTAPTAGYLSARGNWRGGMRGDWMADVLLTNAAAPTVLSTFYVAGFLDGASVRSAGNVGTCTLGGLRNANLFAGVQPAVNDLPDAAGDWTGVLATVRGVYVRGVTGEANSWINSNVAAPTLTYVTGKDILFDNSLNGGAAFGVAAQTLGRLYWYDAAQRYFWPNTNPAEAAGPLPVDDFTVNII